MKGVIDMKKVKKFINKHEDLLGGLVMVALIGELLFFGCLLG